MPPVTIKRHFCPILTKYGFPRQIFMTSLISNYIEMSPVRAALTNAVRRSYGQADGRTDMTQRIGAFHRYASPPKNLITLGRLTQEKSYIYIHTHIHTYRIIHKSLPDFRPLRYSSRDGHAEGEHVNRGRDTPSFCPTLHVVRVWQELDYRIDICRVTKGGHIEHL